VDVYPPVAPPLREYFVDRPSKLPKQSQRVQQRI
jgi:hypothetical protein